MLSNNIINSYNMARKTFN